MTATQRIQDNFAVLFSGILTLLLGGVVTCGWIFNLPTLLLINSELNTMVLSTALCFMLSGAAILAHKKSPDGYHISIRSLPIWLVLVLVGIRVGELASGHAFGIELMLPNSGAQLNPVGHMSLATITGFLAFGCGMLALQWNSRKTQLFAIIMAALLILLGLFSGIGYLLGFRYIFETFYLITDLRFTAFHSSIGMFVLGLGLLSLALRSSQSSPHTVQQQGAAIYSTSLLALALTAAATGLAGISVLERNVLSGTTVNMGQLLNVLNRALDTSLDNRTQRALVVGLDATLRTYALHLLRDTENNSTTVQPPPAIASLLNHGFTAISVTAGEHHKLITGHLLTNSTPYVRLNKGKADADLAWDHGYYLRVRIPLDPATGAFLLLEQEMPTVSRLIEETNFWGDSDTLLLCSSIEQHKLRCFPHRGQPTVLDIPDNYRGEVIAMTRALTNSSGVEQVIDYRGHDVLAAYSKVGNTGLGLVLRKEIIEIYAPFKHALFIIIPLILCMVGFSVWLIRRRVRPLLADIIGSYAAEATAKSRFDAAMQNNPNGFVLYENIKNQDGDITDFRCVYLNKSAGMMASDYLAKQVNNLTALTYLQTFPEQSATFEQFKKVALTGQPHVGEVTLTANDGSALWYQRQTVFMPTGIAVTYRNITQEKNLLTQLESSIRLRTEIVEASAYAIISTTVDGTILSFNKAAERMLWYRADELIGQATPALFHDADEIKNRAASLSQELGYSVLPGFRVFVEIAETHMQEEREWTYVRKDGSRLPVKLSVTALRGADNELHGYLGIAYDISEQKRAAEYIRHIALHDVLTGLPNRALLDDRIKSAIGQQCRNNIPFTLGMVDIDHFKNINDTMGHHIGDKLLKEFVARISSCLRPTDTLARMGGDEFVLLLPGSDETNVHIVLERIQRALVPPMDVGKQILRITCSIGVSISSHDSLDVNELLRRADVAMYWVKKHGRGDISFYSADMDIDETKRVSLEQAMHFALGNGGFTLFYQPQVDLLTDNVVGIEALIRMRTADNQLVSPSNFIPLAEETGLIIPIGHWLLQTACSDLARIQQLLNTRFKVAINISPRQFMNGDLSDQVKNALQMANLDASLLELEITEGVLMDDRKNVFTTLSDLEKLGVTIAIDDFGTGYSSLSYLKRYPISTIKIDQAFVRDLTSDSSDAALTQTIIAMGHSLGLNVIAEGIETQAQLTFLIANRCNQGQGYYIGYPMSFDALLQWFASRSRSKSEGSLKIA